MSQGKNFTAAMAVGAPRSGRDAPKIIVRPTAPWPFEVALKASEQWSGL